MSISFTTRTMTAHYTRPEHISAVSWRLRTGFFFRKHNRQQAQNKRYSSGKWCSIKQRDAAGTTCPEPPPIAYEGKCVQSFCAPLTNNLKRDGDQSHGGGFETNCCSATARPRENSFFGVFPQNRLRLQHKLRPHVHPPHRI